MSLDGALLIEALTSGCTTEENVSFPHQILSFYGSSGSVVNQHLLLFLAKSSAGHHSWSDCKTATAMSYIMCHKTEIQKLI